MTTILSSAAILVKRKPGLGENTPYRWLRPGFLRARGRSMADDRAIRSHG